MGQRTGEHEPVLDAGVPPSHLVALVGDSWSAVAYMDLQAHTKTLRRMGYKAHEWFLDWLFEL